MNQTQLSTSKWGFNFQFTPSFDPNTNIVYGTNSFDLSSKTRTGALVNDFELLVSHQPNDRTIRFLPHYRCGDPTAELLLQTASPIKILSYKSSP